MAKVTLVNKAQKDQGGCNRCQTPINVGDSYYWFANLIGRSSIRKVFCIKHRPRASEMTTSDKLAQLYGAQETLEDAINKTDNDEELISALRDAANEAREVGEAYRESVQNMPENLQNGSQASEMEEKADNCDSWADSLESAADEIESMDLEPEADAICADCDHMFSIHTDGLACTEEKCECLEFESIEDKLEEARSVADNACGELSI